MHTHTHLLDGVRPRRSIHHRYSIIFPGHSIGSAMRRRERVAGSSRSPRPSTRTAVERATIKLETRAYAVVAEPRRVVRASRAARVDRPPLTPPRDVRREQQ